MEIITKSPEETKDAGKRFSATLKGGETICFAGGLGAGKTHFIQGLAEGLGISGRVTSPTFIILREYEYKEDKFLYHVDLYRLETNVLTELENLGITKLWGKKKNIFAIEWADKAIAHLPEKSIWVKIDEIDHDTRNIHIAQP